jgi:type IV secretory pathway TraG/TraD family ATPase VirD4
VLIVQADKRYANIGAPLCNALIALMTANILSQPNSSQRELWLFLDEMANLPKNDALFDWMSLGRSKGCRIVAGTQSISQLKKLYTDHGADTLLSMFTLFASMRLGAAAETASYTAKAFGERVTERPTSSAGPQGNPTLNWHRETLPLVTAADLVQLPQANNKGVEGYLMISGYNAVYRLRWPYPQLVAKAQEHCPAAWLASTPRHTASADDAPASRRELLKTRRASHAVDERH